MSAIYSTFVVYKATVDCKVDFQLAGAFAKVNNMASYRSTLIKITSIINIIVCDYILTNSIIPLKHQSDIYGSHNIPQNPLHRLLMIIAWITHIYAHNSNCM